jgi:hypothetical protein
VLLLGRSVRVWWGRVAEVVVLCPRHVAWRWRVLAWWHGGIHVRGLSGEGGRGHAVAWVGRVALVVGAVQPVFEHAVVVADYV